MIRRAFIQLAFSLWFVFLIGVWWVLAEAPMLGFFTPLPPACEAYVSHYQRVLRPYVWRQYIFAKQE
jgi:hypothetical protein